eukprot:gene8767-11857_t
MHFGQDDKIELRLYTEPDAPYFMSTAYFTHEEREVLLNFPTTSGITCEVYFKIMMERKLNELGNKAILCTSHDLAPAIAEIFGIKKGYEQEKKFRNAIKEFRKK